MRRVSVGHSSVAVLALILANNAFSVLANTRKEHGEMTKEKEPCQNPDGVEREEACLEEEDPSEVAETK